MSNASRKILWETALTETRTTDVEGKGSIREDRFGEKYRWLYNASAFAARVGAPACFDATLYSGANFLKHVLAAPSDEDINFLAGVFVSAIPTLNYGWVKIFGMYDTARIALASGGAAAINDTMFPSTLTDTTGTSAARCYSFLNGVVATSTVNAAVGLINPHAFTPVAIATATGITGTVPQTLPLFIKGLGG